MPYRTCLFNWGFCNQDFIVIVLGWNFACFTRVLWFIWKQEIGLGLNFEEVALLQRTFRQQVVLLKGWTQNPSNSNPKLGLNKVKLSMGGLLLLASAWFVYPFTVFFQIRILEDFFISVFGIIFLLWKWLSYSNKKNSFIVL